MDGEQDVVTLNGHSLAKLATALAKAQGEMTHAQKDRENPAFHSKYATLSAALDACRAPLSKNGLAVVQRFGEAAQGMVSLETILIHESGEQISSVLCLQAKDQTPQAFGSAQTYARRYALMAMVGIAPDDDDAADAQTAGGKVTQPARGATRPDDAPQAYAAPIDRARANRRLHAVLKAAGVDTDDRDYIRWLAGRALNLPEPPASLKDLSPEQIAAVANIYDDPDEDMAEIRLGYEAQLLRDSDASAPVDAPEEADPFGQDVIPEHPAVAR